MSSRLIFFTSAIQYITPPSTWQSRLKSGGAPLWSQQSAKSRPLMGPIGSAPAIHSSHSIENWRGGRRLSRSDTCDPPDLPLLLQVQNTPARPSQIDPEQCPERSRGETIGDAKRFRWVGYPQHQTTTTANCWRAFRPHVRNEVPKNAITIPA